MNDDITLPTDENGAGLERVRAILARLRGDNGCPWDREQTLESLKANLIEECYELFDVMVGADKASHIEELGDVLLQILFQVALREEKGDFKLCDVFNALSDKLIRRHPHVFGDVEVSGASEVLRNWEQIKKHEKTGADGSTRSAIAGVPNSLPALMKAQCVQRKAARVGFDWKDASGPREKVTEEIRELDEAINAKDNANIEAEVGDLLFSVVNLCRFLDVDAEGALRKSVEKFSKRFMYVEKRTRDAGREMQDCTFSELDAIWDESKK